MAVLFGLGGAIGWGTGNYFAACSTKEKSSAFTVYNSNLLALIAFALIVMVFRLHIIFSISLMAFLAVDYLIFTIGLLLAYKAYALGPLSITSPIISGYSLIVLAYSVFIIGDVLKAFQWLGILVLFIGLFAVIYEKGRKRGKVNFKTSGVSIALLSLVFEGIGLSGYVYAIRQSNWETTNLYVIFFLTFWTAVYLIYKKQFKKPKFSKNVIALTGFSLIGTLAVSIGIEKASSAVVFPVSSLSPLITSILGIILLKEKLLKYKLVGVVFIILGLVLMSF